MMAEPFAIPGKKEAAVAVMVGVRQPIRETGLRTTERVGFQVNAFNVDGKSFGAKRMDVTVTLRAEATGMGEYELLSRMDLKPGRYQLRVALNRQEQLAAEMFAKDRSADINIGTAGAHGPGVVSADAGIHVEQNHCETRGSL